ncbi:methanesulfonate monooxygenase (plasmid) [Paraburkholderia graminis]|uniref:aromatic-ring-hydroxylating dioxygenase subunit beta n=1 Tax=Paraburkholderia graminis TaxID=60548 RepID=UPI000DEF6465|nr:aromatic-ring-hydroxylating dioxygenase subunit beta [Paraburkholderia graminis]AXF12584.1 methanesulfonate monooxygenase [Paraburkholderia graminis]
METENAIRALIAKSCLALDSNDYKGYLTLCSENFQYYITTYSPEIRKNMVWLEKDKPDLKNLFDLLPKQNMDRTPLTRHFSIFTVSPGPKEDRVEVMSALQVYRTEHQGGTTSLVAVGKYLDEVELGAEGPLLIKREVRLDTRMLGKGYHVPF